MLDKYSATGARYLAAASIKIRITLILLRRAWLLIRFPVNDYCPLVTMNWFCDFFFNFVHLDILCACMSCAPRMYNAWADARSPGTRAVDKGEGWEWNFPSLWKTSGCSSDSSSSLWLQCCNICIQLFVWVWVFFFQLICSPSEWLPLQLQFSGHSVFLIGKFHKINEPPVSGASMSKRNLGLSLLFPESFLIFP